MDDLTAIKLYPEGELTRPGRTKPIEDGSQVQCSHAYCSETAKHFLEVYIHPEIKLPIGIPLCPEHAAMVDNLGTRDESLDDDIPEVEARLSEDGMQYLVTCPYCGRTHQHGSESKGHRAAHCKYDTESKGYILI